MDGAAPTPENTQEGPEQLWHFMATIDVKYRRDDAIKQRSFNQIIVTGLEPKITQAVLENILDSTALRAVEELSIEKADIADLVIANIYLLGRMTDAEFSQLSYDRVETES